MCLIKSWCSSVYWDSSYDFFSMCGSLFTWPTEDVESIPPVHIYRYQVFNNIWNWQSYYYNYSVWQTMHALIDDCLCVCVFLCNMQIDLWSAAFMPGTVHATSLYMWMVLPAQSRSGTVEKIDYTEYLTKSDCSN